MKEKSHVVVKTDAQAGITKLMTIWQQAKFKQKQSRKTRQVAALSQSKHKGNVK